MTGKFKQGLAANSDLRDAEVELLQARLNLTQSLVNYELAIASLRKRSANSNEHYGRGYHS